jgi:RNA polymerase sigma factor (sigma-70 family)
LEETEAVKVLFGIAKNIYLEWLRRMKAERIVPLNENTDYLGALDDYVNDDFDRLLDELRGLLQAGLQELHPNLRRVVTLRFIENKSRAEVAQEIGMSEKQVHVYQRRAIAALQKWLAAHPHGNPSSDPTIEPTVSPST